MTRTTFLLASSALVAIPSSAGIYHLATSSSKTVEQTESNKEDTLQGPEETREQISEEKETSPAVEEEVRDRRGDSELHEDSSLVLELPSETHLHVGEVDSSRSVREIFLKIREGFSYSLIDWQKGKRTKQIESFVLENDSIRRPLEGLIKEFLNKEENKHKDIKDLAKNVLGLTLIESSEESSWSRLAQIRKDEAETQTDLGQGVANIQTNPLVTGSTKESIMKFCQEPTEENSSLGWQAPKRAEQEKLENTDYLIITLTVLKKAII